MALACTFASPSNPFRINHSDTITYLLYFSVPTVLQPNSNQPLRLEQKLRFFLTAGAPGLEKGWTSVSILEFHVSANTIGGLSPEEMGKVADDALSDLRELLRIPSINPPGGEQPAIDFIKSRLATAGVESTVLDCELSGGSPA